MPTTRRAVSTPWTRTLVATVLALTVAVGTAAAPASADPARPGTADATVPSGQTFYQPPAILPVGPTGTVIRREDFTLALSLPGRSGRIPADATRLMYLSSDTHGAPAAVTGTYLRSTLPWRGPGERPVAAVAVGTQGQGDQCAPSKTLAELIHYTPPLDAWFNYEVMTAYTLLAQGIDVAMTDYHGLGTPAMHDYVNRAAEAHAVLDSLRAAHALTGRDAPTVILGYSQGGGAAAAAAELQPEYAPELDLRGTYAGAPPADLRVVMEESPTINGILPGIGGGAPALIAYVFNGWRADYSEARPAIDRALNPAGQTLLREMAGTCIGEATIRSMLRPPSYYLAGGKTTRQVMADSPVLGRIADEQRIGRRKPGAPVLVAGSTTDDVIPYRQVRQLAVDWCRLGATVQLERTAWIPPVLPSSAVGHVLEVGPALTGALEWINARLAGRPAPSNCAQLP